MVSNNLINRNNQLNARGTNQSVKLPKVATNIPPIQPIISNQLPEIVKRVDSNGGSRIPSSKDTKRKIV